jgi:hypothetical protein
MIEGAVGTLNREIIELVRLIEIWSKDPQDQPNKKMFRYYEDLLSQHRLAIARLTRI